MATTFEVFLLFLALTFIALYFTKNQSCRGSGKIIDIYDVEFQTSSENGFTPEIIINTGTLTFKSKYLTRYNNVPDVFAYFSSNNNNLGLVAKDNGDIVTGLSPGTFQTTFKYVIFDGSSNLNVYVYWILSTDNSDYGDPEQRRDKSDYQEINIQNIPCIFEQTLVKTATGLKRTKDITVGDALVQPSGRLSRVNKIAKKLIPKYDANAVKLPDSRLYQYGNTIITHWHKIQRGEEMVFPMNHPEFRELVNSGLEGRAYVYNFKLDHDSDLIITEDEVVLESLYKYQPPLVQLN